MSIFDPSTVDYVTQYLKKGDQVYIEGKVQTRKWQDKSGADRYSTEVIVNSIGGQLVGWSSRVSSYSTWAENETSGDLRSSTPPNLEDVPF